MEVLPFMIGDCAYPVGLHLIKNYKSRNVVKVDIYIFFGSSMNARKVN